MPQPASSPSVPARRSAAAWSRELSLALARPVELSFGRARRDVIVARSDGAVLRVRLNRRFAEAPDEVAAALATWLRVGRRAPRACALLDRWIEQLGTLPLPEPARAPRLRPEGTCWNLAPLAREVVHAHFAGELEDRWHTRVTWGRRARRRRARRHTRRTLQLGSFDPELELIRVHPVLDQPAVPRFFVRYVLFHEFLHAALDAAAPPGRARGRPHPPAFVAREERYPDYRRAVRWQERRLGALLESARTLRPMPVPAETGPQAAPAKARAVAAVQLSFPLEFFDRGGAGAQ